MNHHYRGLFENWEIGVAKNVIREFKSKWKCLRIEDYEDLLQECLTQWLFNREKYDSSKGASQSTYMSRIVRNKLMDLIDEQTSDKRKIAHESISIDQPLNNGEDASSLLDVLPCNSDFHSYSELAISIEQAFPKLTNIQKLLCQYIEDGCSSTSELSQMLGIARASVYREIERIRIVFEKEGLKKFLK